MTSFAGLRGTGSWATDQRPKNFREMILWLTPNGTAPLFALMAKVRKDATTDAEFSWWDEPVDIVRLQVNKSGGYAATATLMTTDSVDPSSGSLNTNWGSALNLVPGDVLMVEPSADAAVFDHEQVLVTAVHSATQFSVQRGYAGTTAATIADNRYLVKLGTSFAEGTDAPNSASRNPIKSFNYTQIFKTTYEVTGTATQTETRTGDEVKNSRNRKIHDHSRDLEMAMLFGSRSETTGDNGQPLRTTNGLRAQISPTNTTILANNWSIANAATAGNDLLSAISPCFDYDTAAGNERIIFAGNNALNQMNAAIMKSSGVGGSNINFAGREKLYGMSFQRFELPQGTVFVKTHPLMNRHTLYKNSMFIIDFSALKYRPYRGRDTKFTDNIQNKSEDVLRGQWMTEAGLEVTAGGLTCGYIGGFGASIA